MLDEKHPEGMNFGAPAVSPAQQDMLKEMLGWASEARGARGSKAVAHESR
ncbi:MAG: hypothetical protein IIA41_06285 [SAR324 cluster bacterium]|nr:hypothetical protein [SAR324 cluster bacterium]